MKTPDEIKKGLECCSNKNTRCRKGCPYVDDGSLDALIPDALALIRQLETKVSEVEKSWEAEQRNATYLTTELAEVKCRFLRYIRNLTNAVPNWISVEDERKPKHGQEYFIRYAFGIKGDEYNSHGPFYGAAKWNSAGGNGYVDGPHFDNEGMNEIFVTHWMEIPQVIEPPKEGKCE